MKKSQKQKTPNTIKQENQNKENPSQTFNTQHLILFTEKIEIGLGLLSTTLASVFGYLAGVGSSKT